MSSRLLCCTGSLDGGGSERQLWQVATRIDSAFFSPQIYLLAKRGTYLASIPDSLTVHAFDDATAPSALSVGPWLHMPGQIHRRQVAHLRSTLVREQIDVVYDRTFHMTLVTAAACRQARVPRVSVIVSPPSRDLGASHERFRWLKRRLLARAYRDPLAIPVAVSSAVADDASKFYGVQRDTICVIENPVDVAAVQLQATNYATDDHELTTPNSDGMRIVVVGRLSPEKGQDTAIKALAKAIQQPNQNNTTLHLIGDGPAHAQLHALAGQLGIQENVHFHGFLQNPYPRMKNADLICIPSRYEGLPNVALEAMALGRPLLVTDCSRSVEELVAPDQSRGAMVPVDDTVAMAQKFIDCHKNSEAWVTRAQQGQAWVTAHYGIEQGIRRVETVLRACIERRAQRGTRA